MISVALATYNGERYLRQQIDSVLNQSIQDIELIIGDDNSVDGTFGILEEYARKDDRIKIFKNAVNLGFKKNFENIIRKCQGEYIALCDQDDIWFCEHLEMLYKAMEPEAQIVCGRPIFVDENNIELPRKKDYFYMYTPPCSSINIARYIFLNKSAYQGASMLIRKSFFDKALPIPIKAHYHDSWFAILSCFTGGMVYVNKPTMRYRRYGDSITLNEYRICAAKRMLVLFLYNTVANDRSCFIENIKDRCESLTKEQIDFLNKMEKMIKRQKRMWGRLINAPYLIWNYKAVLACDLKHLFF